MGELTDALANLAVFAVVATLAWLVVAVDRRNR